MPERTGPGAPSEAELEALPERLCQIFLGWRLGDDRDALLALGEGALRIDLLTGECWCDDEPLPALGIAAELDRELDRVGLADRLEAAHLDALFAARPYRSRGREGTALELACRVVLRVDGREYAAEARNQTGGA